MRPAARDWRARPKSRIFTRPSLASMMFSGLRSRWTTPAACAAARPSATCAAISISLRTGTRLAVKQRAERFAFEEFADDVLLADLDAEIVDGDDVGVIERGDGAGFALEAAAEIGGCAVFAQNFDGDIAVEAGVAGAVDLAHAADPERGLDLVGAESGVRSERHRSAIPRTQLATWPGKRGGNSFAGRLPEL